jgi:antirestriction protein ArdC
MKRDSLIDEFLACSGASIREGFGEAYYRPGDDYISLPSFAAFKSAAHFYGTTFHELGHRTGHKSRLDRDLRNRFGERAYAAEELIAELCAAFLCAEFNLDGDLRHAGYIESWIGLLKADKRAIFTACSKAQDIAPLVNDLIEWMKRERAKLSRHNEVAKAMDYMLKRIHVFTRFLEDAGHDQHRGRSRPQWRVDDG